MISGKMPEYIYIVTFFRFAQNMKVCQLIPLFSVQVMKKVYQI